MILDDTDQFLLIYPKNQVQNHIKEGPNGFMEDNIKESSKLISSNTALGTTPEQTMQLFTNQQKTAPKIETTLINFNMN
jgi:hypothetical protein